MKMQVNFRAAIAVLLVQLAIVLILGYTLPADVRIPAHWNYKMEVDGYVSREMGVWGFWLMNAGIFLLMVFLRKFSPVYRHNRERFEAVMPVLILGLVIFFALIHIYSVLLAKYPPLLKHMQFLFVILGALFIFIGNILPKIPRNFIAGVRTPWTLFSDEVWHKTTRVGGYCFFIMGVLMVGRGLLNLTAVWANYLLIVALVLLIFVPVIYSFVAYLKLKGRN